VYFCDLVDYVYPVSVGFVLTDLDTVSVRFKVILMENSTV